MGHLTTQNGPFTSSPRAPIATTLTVSNKTMCVVASAVGKPISPRVV